MGLFTELGRQVEEFKQAAKNAAESDETFRCPACDEQFDSAHEQCPECGKEMGE
jgi:rubrerythrin